MPELTQLLRVKSMMRYLPANGTAGLARFCERRLNRSPWPPARIIASTLLIAQLILSAWSKVLAIIDRKSTRLNSSHDQISYAVFCLKKKKNKVIAGVNADGTPNIPRQGPRLHGLFSVLAIQDHSERNHTSTQLVHSAVGQILCDPV